MSPKVTRITFLLCPGYASVSFICAVEPLRAANQLSGQKLYTWDIVSAEGGAVLASNGIATMSERGPGTIQKTDVIIVCAGHNPQNASRNDVKNWLRTLARHGAAVGGVSTGAWVMADAGLLEGRRCTIHWENSGSFSEAFPTIDVSRTVFEIDHDRFTSAGGTASMDMMLQLVARDHGPALATEIARYFQHERIRTTGDLQTEARDAVIRVKSQKLLNAITVMEANLETPLSAADLAENVGITPRQLQRLFKEHTKRAPNRFYLDLRLRHARLLLLQTALPVVDVAVAAGFVSHAHFSKCYRQLFDITPSEERRRAF